MRQAWVRGSRGTAAGSGMARRMTSNGAPLPVVMRQGRWESERMPARYVRNESAGEALAYPVMRGGPGSRITPALSRTTRQTSGTSPEVRAHAVLRSAYPCLAVLDGNGAFSQVFGTPVSPHFKRAVGQDTAADCSPLAPGDPGAQPAAAPGRDAARRSKPLGHQCLKPNQQRVSPLTGGHFLPASSEGRETQLGKGNSTRRKGCNRPRTGDKGHR